MSMYDSTTLTLAGVSAASTLDAAITARTNIFDMTQAAENAVLRPKDCGRFDHSLRAALAARVARLASDEELCAHYLGAAGEMAILADLTQTGADHGLGGVISFVDKVANQTRDVAPEDISTLQDAGIEDADIVRLCELVAFLAYQIRVMSGLRLMKGTTA